MSDWADIEAERSGLMDVGVPCDARPTTFDFPQRPAPAVPPSEVQRARFRIDAARKRRKWVPR